MRLDELKKAMEAVQSVVGMAGREVDVVAIRPLYLLAEDVIRLQGKMPKKWTFFETGFPTTKGDDKIIKEKNDRVIIRNKTIDDCVKAMAGKEE